MAKNNELINNIDFSPLGDPTQKDVENFELLVNLFFSTKTTTKKNIIPVIKQTQLIYLLTTFKNRKLKMSQQEVN